MKIFFTLEIFLIMLLFGCGENFNQIEVNSTNNEIFEEYEESTYESTDLKSEDKGPENGGTLKISMRIPKTLNPLINDDITVDNALKPVFETLFKIDESGKVVPNIAESYSFENDMLIIKIKSGLKWHNGTDITAKDVIFSLNTIKAQGNNCIYKNALSNVSNFIENGNTVTLKLSKTNYYNIYNFCFPVISADYYGGKDDVSMKPMGSGSFKFLSYQLANELVLEKCDGINGSPYIDKISVIITNDRQTDLYAFEQSITDVIQTDTNEWGKYSTSKKVNLTEFNTNNFEFIGYNHKNPFLSNLSLRQAISHAIPTDELFESIYLSHGAKTHIPINPNYWFYAKDNLTPPNYNIGETSNILSSLNYTKEQLTFSILVNSENKTRCEAAVIIAERLNQAGFNINVNRQPFEEYQSMLASDNFDIFIGGIKLSDSGELRPLLSGGAVTTGVNYFNYSNTQMDELISKTEAAKSDEEFKNAHIELQKFIETQIPCTGICFKYESLLTNDNINGEKIPIINNIYNNINKWYISSP